MKSVIQFVEHGCGAFLKPSCHPEHSRCIMYNGNKMSLTAAAWSTTNPALAIIAKKELAKYTPGPVDSDWVRRVLGYYQHAWRNPNMTEPQCWYNCNIFYCVDPLGASFLDHFGVHWIQRFYPDYFPTEKDFQYAYWDGKTALDLRISQDAIPTNTVYEKNNPVFKMSNVDTSRVVGSASGTSNTSTYTGYDPVKRLPHALASAIEASQTATLVNTGNEAVINTGWNMP